MKKFIVTMDCPGSIEPKQITISANSKEEAKSIAQKQFPKCKITNVQELLLG
jgi:hypothetical protein